MTDFDGDVHEMAIPSLDDRALEALLHGGPSAQSGFDWLQPFVEDLGMASREPAPVVRPALARLLSEGFSTELGDLLAAGPPPQRRRRRLTAKVAGLGFALAAVGTTAAGAAGVLPEPAQQAVAAVVEAGTPFSFPDKADDRPATGPTAGNGAVRPTAPTTVRSVTPTTGPATGLDRANQTPAAGHVPTSLPPTAGQPAGPTPGPNGLNTAATTPAAGRVPTSVPADTRPTPPSTRPEGGQGRDNAGTTPAPTRVPGRP